MEREREATIYDIAELTGVSPSTVSRALRGNGQLSAATVKRVRDAAESMGYRPNAVARSLSDRTSDSIALMLPDIANPFFPELVKEVQLRAHHHGLTVLLCNTSGDAGIEVEYLEMLSGRRIDGVLAMGLAAPEEVLRKYLGYGMRLVTLDRSSALEEIISVQSDHLQGGVLATQHLLELGHRDIGYISGPLSVSVAAERRAGHLEAMELAGISPNLALDLVGDFAEESGYGAVGTLLSSGVAFSALAVGNDLMALGAIAALREAKVDVPDAVSVVGFDDISLGRYAVPPLTTIRQPLVGLARVAVDMLVGEGATATGSPPRLPVELVVRGSTRAVPAPG